MMVTRTLALLVLLASVPAWADGTYVGFGRAGLFALGDDIGDSYQSSADGGVARLSLGRRFGSWAVEGVLFGANLESLNEAHSLASLGLDLRYYVPLLLGVELFVHGGVNKSFLGGAGESAFSGGYEGQGYAYGTGLQYAFRLIPVLEAAVWLDLNRQEAELHLEGSDSLDANASVITVGVSIGTGL